MQNLCAHGCKFHHLLVRDEGDTTSSRHHSRVGAEDTIDIGVNLANISVQRGCQRDRRRIGATSSESGDVFGILRDTLEARHDRDSALGKSLADPPGRNIDDPRGTMSRVGNQPRLRSGVTARLSA